MRSHVNDNKAERQTKTDIHVDRYRQRERERERERGRERERENLTFWLVPSVLTVAAVSMLPFPENTLHFFANKTTHLFKAIIFTEQVCYTVYTGI